MCVWPNSLSTVDQSLSKISDNIDVTKQGLCARLFVIYLFEKLVNQKCIEKGQRAFLPGALVRLSKELWGRAILFPPADLRIRFGGKSEIGVFGGGEGGSHRSPPTRIESE